MGKLRIGSATPASMGAIKKVYVGTELIWPEGGVTSQPISDEHVVNGIGGAVSAGVTFHPDGTVTSNVTAQIIANWYSPTTPNIGAIHVLRIDGTGTGNGQTTFPPSGVPLPMTNVLSLEATATGGARVSFVAWNGTYTILNANADTVLGNATLDFSFTREELTATTNPT